MSAGDWYRWWGGAVSAVGSKLKAPRLPHPARLIEVERERVARRETMFVMLWTVVFAGPYFGTVMGGAVPVLAQVAQLSDRWYGLIQAMPALAMLGQLPGALMVTRVKHRPGAVFVLGIAARLIWIPVAAIPLVLDPGAVATGAFLGLVVTAWVCFHLAGLAWQSFMGDLVPARRRGKYFGARIRLFSASNLVSSVVLAMLLPVAGEPGANWMIFGIFTVASLIGAVELLWYRRAYDPPRRKPAMRAADLLVPLRDREFFPFLVLGFLIAASNGIVGPFLWRHFLNAQHMAPVKVTLILQTSALLGVLLTAPIWGAWVDRYGTKAAMWFAIVGGQVATLFWPVVSVENWWLGVVVMLVGVAFWTGVDVSLVNRLFKHGQKGGAGYFAIFNGTLAVAGFGFTALGGEIAERFHNAAWIKAVGDWGAGWGLSFNVYLLLSFVCVGLRCLALVWLMYFIPRDKPTPTSLAVRAMAGQAQAGAIGVLAWPWKRIRG